MRHDVIEALELLARQVRERGGVGITLRDIEEVIIELNQREQEMDNDMNHIRSLDAGQS